VQGKIKGYPVWGNPNQVEPFLQENLTPPPACPSIVNAKQIGWWPWLSHLLYQLANK
jgi:glycerate dehydrogenase